MQAEQSKIVFLDIDGVLQPFSNTRRFQVDAPSEAGTGIVVSSDWHDYNEDAALKALLAIHGLDGYFKGSTAPFAPKAESITGYLSEHADEIAAYVILDDDPRVSALPNGLQVTGSLSKKDADEAVRILAGQGQRTHPCSPSRIPPAAPIT